MKSSRLRLRAHLALLLAAASLAAAADTSLPRQQLHIGKYAFDVEVASSPQQRELGLMGRTRLDDDAGMLFVFEHKARHCFWMKNTALALSIAFVADDGSLINIDDMLPQTQDLHCAQAAVRYALEVKQGSFRSNDIRPGMRITGGPFGTHR